jgi:hypothetical protein
VVALQPDAQARALAAVEIILAENGRLIDRIAALAMELGRLQERLRRLEAAQAECGSGPNSSQDKEVAPPEQAHTGNGGGAP